MFKTIQSSFKDMNGFNLVCLNRRQKPCFWPFLISASIKIKSKWTNSSARIKVELLFWTTCLSQSGKVGRQYTNVWFKKTGSIRSGVSLMRIVPVFLNQTLCTLYLLPTEMLQFILINLPLIIKWVEINFDIKHMIFIHLYFYDRFSYYTF